MGTKIGTAAWLALLVGVVVWLGFHQVTHIKEDAIQYAPPDGKRSGLLTFDLKEIDARPSTDSVEECGKLAVATCAPRRVRGLAWHESRCAIYCEESGK